jgi:hypothetical protein
MKELDMKPFVDRVAIPFGLLGLVLLPLACTARWRAVVRAPRQGWWEERGPVVPHDQFPADCTLCHAGDDWRTIREDFQFDHLAETGTPLNGAHALAECLRCHNDRGPVALFAQRGCAGCHEDVHRGQMGPDCVRCHQENDWRPDGPIALHAATRLPLVGAHAALQCWACHTGAAVGNFKNTDAQCVSCHLDDFQATTNPDHVAQGYPTTCEECHGFVAFDQAAIFNHAGITDNCASCHLDDYQRTNDPNHQASGFSTTCEDCHSSFTTWRGAVFSHVGITNGCATCHLGDYQASLNPRHSAAGFSQACETCHASTTTWQGARYADHAFPIYSGAHRNFDCTQCHLTNTNYSAFSCTHCHAHRQSAMNSRHSGVGGYSWQSNACYHCHPNGRG